ncbi:protein kinase domain-containing protein [Gordonia sp. VNK21]|uniref:serine/threonine-protein kinase n=1 Tax=Gordonia sp. VNK21 TaxID=3382483 RepID=UPI0038D4F16D
MLNPGQIFAGYRVVRLLGAGGMGEVYLAAHPRLPREDALKVLPAELTNDPMYRKRFTREAELAAGLDHPNIVSVYDRGEDQGQLWLTMKYVPGSDADRLIKESGPFSPAATAEVVSAVGDALDYAYGRGLLHRDVKPANIVIDRTEATRRKIYLTDFGIARTVGNESRITAANLTVGSIQYTSPEQLAGADDLDGRSDQYSLACTAFRLLTGRPPYAAASTADVINAHLSNPIPSVTERRPELPAAVDAVLARAMSKDRSGRYPTSSDFARDLAAALRGDQPAGVAPVPPPSGGSTPAYQPTLIAGAAGGAGAAAAQGAQPASGRPHPAAPGVQPPGRQTPPTKQMPPTKQEPPASYPGYGPSGPNPGTPGQPGYPAYSAQQSAPQPAGYQPAGYGYQPGYGGPGGPGGPPPYGPGGASGDGGGSKKSLHIILGLIGLVAVIVAVSLAVLFTGDDEPAKTATSSSTSTTTSTSTSSRSSTTTTTSGPGLNVPVANGVPTRCVAGNATGSGSRAGVRTGPIRIPGSDLPSATDWRGDPGSRLPFLEQADGIIATRPAGETGWMAQILVATLPAAVTGDPTAVGRKFLECLPASTGYTSAGPGRMQITKEEPGTLDNSSTKLTLFQASLPVRDRPGIAGDDFFIVVVDSAPMSMAIGISPINDQATRGEVTKAISGLKVLTGN